MSASIIAPRRQLAKRLADGITKVYSSPPIPVLEIAQDKGVQVVFASFGRYSQSVAGFCDFEGARLLVNSDDIPTRQNFTLAHELGHWIMHRDIFLKNPDKYSVLPRANSYGLNAPLEREANTFAAHLLVPSRLLNRVRTPTTSVTALADIFRVSRTMMEIRIRP